MTTTTIRPFEKKIKILTGLAALALPVLSLSAQTAPPASTAGPETEAVNPPSSGQDLSQMVVTGSYLTGAQGAGSLPLKTITGDQIARSGFATVSDLLQRIPQNGSGAFTTQVNTGLSFSPGASAIALRNLKEDATLVLVNGMRMPYFPLPQEGTDSFVDLNSIPLAAIDHIDILKEGASALYGTDAIAGVVNIILKDGFEGTIIETRYGNTTRNDLSEVRESLVSGVNTDRFTAMVSAEYYHRNSLADVDRPFSANGDHRKFGLEDYRSSASNYVLLEGSADLYTVPKGNGRNLTTGDLSPALTPEGDIVRKYNTNGDSELLPEVERYGFYGNFTYKIADHVDFYSNVLFSHSRVHEQVAPSPIFDSDGIVVPASNPFNPLGEDVLFLYRAVGVGPRKNITETRTYRFAQGFRFIDLPNNWTADVNITAAESKTVQRNANFLSISRVQKALNQTGPDKAFNIFGTGDADNSQSVIDSLRANINQTGLTRLNTGSFNAKGDTFDLPAGPIGLAIGGNYNDENYRLQPDQRSLNNDIVGQGGASGFGKRNTKGVYYEIGIPIVSSDFNWIGLNTLTLNASGRFDEYTDFGDVFKPKFSVLYKPVKQLSIRGSYSEGFRAPSLPELFTSPVGQFAPISDAQVTSGPYDAPITQGGNPNLRPETSYSYDVGFTLDVPYIKGLSLRTDFFRIEQRNVISAPDPQFVVDNEGLFPGAITRGGANNQITNIDVTYTNLGKTVTDGVDIGLDYVLPTKFGTFGVSFDATYNNSSETVSAPNTPNTEFTGTFASPMFRATTEFDYEIGGFTLANIWYYTGDYQDQISFFRRVGAYTTVDLQLSYEFFKESAEKGGPAASDGKSIVDGKSMSTGKSTNAIKDTVLENHSASWQQWLKGAKFTVGCNNIADENPPYANTQEGYDPTTASPIGRFYYVSLSKKF